MTKKSIKAKIYMLNSYSNSLKNENIKYNFIKNNEATIINNLNNFEKFVNIMYKIYLKK